MVQEWVDDYELSVTSRRNYLRSVKRCYKWSKRQGYIDANPIADMEVPSAEEKEISLTQTEFDRLMTYVRNPCLADLMRVTWESGCRPLESLRVEARHVDVEHQRLVFYKSESKMKRVSRVVYLADTAMAITRKLMLAHPTGPLFHNTVGNPWTKDSVNCGFDALRVRKGKEEMVKIDIQITDDEIGEFIVSLRPTKTVKGIVREKTNAELRHEGRETGCRATLCTSQRLSTCRQNLRRNGTLL